MAAANPTVPEQAVEVRYNPGAPHSSLPVEVLTSEELKLRMPAHHAGSLQRLRFHLLILCTKGEGTHDVDFTQYPLGLGSILHIRPGQTQRFCNGDAVETEMLLWPEEPQSEKVPWFPGSNKPTSFTASTSELASVRRWIADIRSEQHHFIPSQPQVDLLTSMLQVVLAKVNILSAEPPDSAPFPDSYRQLRELLEDRVLLRPTVAALAAEIGYSTRTLDRATREATNQTAKQIVDERTGLELRRRLADVSQSIAAVRDAFGFTDSSAFTKFTRRHLGEPPSAFRARYDSPQDPLGE